MSHPLRLLQLSDTTHFTELNRDGERRQLGKDVCYLLLQVSSWLAPRNKGEASIAEAEEGRAPLVDTTEFGTPAMSQSSDKNLGVELLSSRLQKVDWTLKIQ